MTAAALATGFAACLGLHIMLLTIDMQRIDRAQKGSPGSTTQSLVWLLPVNLASRHACTAADRDTQRG